MNPSSNNSLINKVLITIFSMLAELETDFISERTKEGLRARMAKGIKLGKPKGTLQASIYDNDRDKIFHLHALGVPLNIVIFSTTEAFYASTEAGRNLSIICHQRSPKVL